MQDVRCLGVLKWACMQKVTWKRTLKDPRPGRPSQEKCTQEPQASQHTQSCACSSPFWHSPHLSPVTSSGCACKAAEPS